MTTAIFTMELRRRARSVILAAIGLISLTVLLGALFPSLAGSIGNLKLGKGINGLIGGGDFSTIAGWLRAEITSIYGPLVFAGIAITAAAATTAGEEQDHILALVLAHPVPRPPAAARQGRRHCRVPRRAGNPFGPAHQHHALARRGAANPDRRKPVHDRHRGLRARAGRGLPQHRSRDLGPGRDHVRAPPDLRHPALQRHQLTGQVPASNAGDAVWRTGSAAHMFAPWAGFAVFCAYTAIVITAAAVLMRRRDT